jgi:hypothetical protein
VKIYSIKTNLNNLQCRLVCCERGLDTFLKLSIDVLYLPTAGVFLERVISSS